MTHCIAIVVVQIFDSFSFLVTMTQIHVVNEAVLVNCAIRTMFAGLPFGGFAQKSKKNWNIWNFGFLCDDVLSFDVIVQVVCS